MSTITESTEPNVNRRQFLKFAGVAGAGVVAGHLLSEAKIGLGNQEKNPSMEEELRTLESQVLLSGVQNRHMLVEGENGSRLARNVLMYDPYSPNSRHIQTFNFYGVDYDEPVLTGIFGNDRGFLVLDPGDLQEIEDEHGDRYLVANPKWHLVKEITYNQEYKIIADDQMDRLRLNSDKDGMGMKMGDFPVADESSGRRYEVAEKVLEAVREGGLPSARFEQRLVALGARWEEDRENPGRYLLRLEESPDVGMQ